MCLKCGHRFKRIEVNAPVLRAMPKLKRINGKPAKDVLDTVSR